MPLRATAAAVQAVVATVASEFDSFIATANTIVEEQLLASSMSEARLTQIEIYLAAHFLLVRDRQAKTENYGSASVTYSGDFGMNLKSTTQGQTAVLLDTSGILTTLGNKTTSFAVVH